MSLFSNRNNSVLFGLLILLTSCVSMGKISIQVSVPAKRAVPEGIQSITLMNRSMTSEFADLNTDSLENLFIRKKLGLDNVFLDSIAADTTLHALGNTLFQSGRFDVVIPVRRNLPNNNSSYKDPLTPLTLGQVKQICNEFNTDALLCLEYFDEKVNTSYRAEAYSLDPDARDYSAFVQVAYHSRWKLYQPAEKLLAANFEVKDTIFWERYGKSLQETYENLPLVKEALMAGAIENGENLANYISPGWKNEERSYFITNDKNADMAVSLLKKNDWKGAREIWMKYSTASSVDFRSKIEYNLALAAEMNGELNEALEWAKKSVQSKYSRIAEDYVRLLSAHLANQ